MRIPRALGPLRHRPFRTLVSGQITSNVGDACYAVALPWYVLASHGGALLLGTVLAAYGIPRTALVAIGGHASDRFRPWTVMMAADAGRALAVAALAYVAASGPARAVLLVPVAALLGAGEGMFLPASFAIVPSLLPDEELQAGNALTSGATQLATLAGPALGGLVVALAGPGPAFAFDAATFALSSCSLLAVRSYRHVAAIDAPRPAHDESRSPDVAPLEPLPAVARELELPSARTVRDVLRSERVLQMLLLVSFAANLGSGGLSEVALPALAHGTLHAGAGGYGGLLASFGGGALLGTVVAGQARRAARPFVVACAAFLAEGVFIALVPYVGGTVTACAAMVLVGATNGFGNVVSMTAFQRWAPPDLLGRLMGLVMLASFGVFPLSVLLAGVTVHRFGPALFFPLAAAVLVVAVGIGLTQSPVRDFGRESSPLDGAELRAGRVGG